MKGMGVDLLLWALTTLPWPSSQSDTCTDIACLMISVYPDLSPRYRASASASDVNSDAIRTPYNWGTEMIASSGTFLTNSGGPYLGTPSCGTTILQPYIVSRHTPRDTRPSGQKRKSGHPRSFGYNFLT